MQNDLQDILNSPYIKPDEVSKVMESFDAIVQNSLDTVDFIDEVLSSDYLKMSDAERAEILKAKELESKQMVSSIMPAQQHCLAIPSLAPVCLVMSNSVLSMEVMIFQLKQVADELISLELLAVLLRFEASILTLLQR